jgi:NAD(P)-dependent dehydrogenase (short-subunit alcohol dehydrogenase family)
LAEEVIVITGGVDGLGGLLAETYGMRNANIAVLDTKKVDEDEAEDKGVLYYQCDVSDAKQVEAAAAKIVEDVGYQRQNKRQLLTVTARSSYDSH